MKKIILATHNKGKVKELKEILSDLDYDIVTKTDIGIDYDPIEDGISLEENAFIKAKYIFDRCKSPVIADDTGLFVEALEGEPGVHSARYGGEEGNDSLNREKLLKELIEVDNRNAYFETVICFIGESGKESFTKGRCYGKINRKEVGENGFGYDSIFIPTGYEETFAQLTEVKKNKISHRGKALVELRMLLEEL